MKKKVGWIGTGNLGAAIVKRLLKSGYEVYVYNRSLEKAKQLENEGAVVLSTPFKVTFHCNTIFLCLSGKVAIDSILFSGKDPLLQEGGRPLTIFDTSTVDPDYAIYLSKKVCEFNCRYIESPVSGGPEGAMEGNLTTILSGQEKDIQSNKHIVQSFSNILHEFYDPGKAQRLKVLNNLAESINLIGAAEVISIGQHHGLTIEDMYKVFLTTRGNSIYMNVLFERLLSPKGNISASLDVRVKDLNLSSTMRHNLTTPISDLVHNLFESSIELTGGQYDQTECIKLYKNKGDEKWIKQRDLKSLSIKKTR